MFACFCGFGPGHKSTCNITKVFRDEIKEAFGIIDDDMGDTSAMQSGEYDEHGDEDESEGESDGDSEDSEDSEDGEEDFWDPDRDDFEDDLGYAPL
jgi:hypothetical protein